MFLIHSDTLLNQRPRSIGRAHGVGHQGDSGNSEVPLRPVRSGRPDPRSLRSALISRERGPPMSFSCVVFHDVAGHSSRIGNGRKMKVCSRPFAFALGSALYIRM